ncbi:MAG TPA: biotin-dependent carboxyltransferase family protein [Candidatus Dormibacteraeota bacterium]|nr:biotin-dependent carboxyltransferase family protein [Candidatus Dormibacteraeota bacterium]
MKVEEPGLLTTIQDLGRPHAVASGVPPGGAMDRFAHNAANLIAGNEMSAATLECTVRGPRLTAITECVIAVTGADFAIRINGHEAPMWSAIALDSGDELAFGPRRAGARAYIAIAGGVAGDRWLGSLSTYLMVGQGGMGGRPLAAGDVISTAVPAESRVQSGSMPLALRPTYSDHTLRVIGGPHLSRLTSERRAQLFGSVFTLAPDSNRMGYRLDGPRLEVAGPELLSFGLVAGSVQLPSGGQPILLMADHQTAGGYPVVAVLVSASMPVAAQLLPGDELRFEEIDLETALRLRADQRAALASIR